MSPRTDGNSLISWSSQSVTIRGADALFFVRREGDSNLAEVS